MVTTVKTMLINRRVLKMGAVDPAGDDTICASTSSENVPGLSRVKLCSSCTFSRQIHFNRFLTTEEGNIESRTIHVLRCSKFHGPPSPFKVCQLFYHDTSNSEVSSIHTSQNAKGTNTIGQCGGKQNGEEGVHGKWQHVQRHGSISLSDLLETATNCEQNAEK